MAQRRVCQHGSSGKVSEQTTQPLDGNKAEDKSGDVNAGSNELQPAPADAGQQSTQDALEASLAEESKDAAGEARPELSGRILDAARSAFERVRTKVLAYPKTSAAALIAVLALCALAFGSWFYEKREIPFAGGAATIDVDIASGMSGRQIAERTREAGVEVSVPAMLAAMRLAKGGAIHAGRYRFERGVTMKRILEKYRAGDVLKGAFRVADGATLRQTLGQLAQAPEVKGTAGTMTDDQLISAIGAAEKHLEGLLAPETYKFNWGTSDIAVLRIAYQHQKKALEEEWAARDKSADILKSPYEALILASIIEKETGQPSDRPLVSSVFHNRLKLGMRLQTDPAVIYGQGPDFEGRLRTKHLRAPGPYNTYLNTGLPPTPIAMPSRASIHAALHPADTKLLYFVARGDGTTKFSETLAEHEKAVDIYQRGKKK